VLFQFASLVLELLCSLSQCRSPVRVHFQVGKLWLTTIFFFSMLFGCYFEVLWLMWWYVICECMSVLFWTGVGDCCRKTMARPDNLAQASQSRLGEMDRDLPRPFYAKGRSGDQLSFWASEYLAQARGVSPKRDPAWAPASFFEPSPGEGGSLEWDPSA